tara:strand:+ start:335 stop:730 length:396 start_codon:yes stop_codon:yes gene_type:complete
MNKMSNTVIFDGGVETIATRADGSIKVVVGSQELSSDTMTRLFDLRRKVGYVLISTKEISQEQIDAVETSTANMEFSEKTPSQRLRGVLYILWEKLQPKENDQGIEKFVDFDLFYKRKLNEIINHYKKQLD